MKKVNYIHLVTVSSVEAKMIQEALKKQRIPSKLRMFSFEDVLSAYGAQSKREIFVPEELLEKAKNLLNLAKPT